MDSKIPKGYKQTEVGIIPMDWEVKNFSKLGSFYKGKGISSKDLVSDGLPCIMYGDIYVKFNTKFSNPDFRINKLTASKSSLGKTGDLFFTTSGETAEEIGKCVIYQGSDSIYIGGDIIALTPNLDNDSLFLAYIQNSRMLLSQKANLGQGHTVVHIYTEHIKSLKTPLPPTKKEQTTIAKVISDTDDLILSLEKLISKKQNIKQGTMQLLLTGKKRLPGFTGDWEVKKIGDIMTVVGGGTPKTSFKKYWNGDINWFTPTEVGDNKFVFKSKRGITEEGQRNSSAKLLPVGTILLTTRAGIGDLAILKIESSTNQGFQSLITKPLINNEYVYYLMLTKKNALLNRASGSTFLEISPNNVKSILLQYPKNSKEQTAIVKVLSDMDIEIEKLENNLNKYKMIKQGMMQKLLTGQIRLI